MLHALGLSLILASVTPDDRIAQALKLAQAIAATGSRSKVGVYAGALPPRFPKDLPLPKAPLLGSVVTFEAPSQVYGYQEDGRPAKVAVPASDAPPAQVQLYYDASVKPHSFLADYLHELNASGFTKIDLSGPFFDEESQRGGFAVPTPPPAVFPQYFCKADALLLATPVSNMPGVIGIGVLKGRGATMTCAAATLMKNAAPQPKLPPLPTLEAPEGATLQNRADNDAGWPAGSSASIRTTRPLADVGAGFAKQMTAAGWNGEPAASSAGAFVQTFRKTLAGRHLFATLSIVSTGKPERFDATLQQRDLDAIVPPAMPGFSFP